MRVANLVAWVSSQFLLSRQTRSHRQTRFHLQLEKLEARDVPAINPTGLEQEMLELVNRMRISPSTELSKLLTSTNPLQAVDPQVQAALNYFGVSGSMLVTQWSSLKPAQPLAWSNGLLNSSRTHNQAMIAADTQSHQLPGEASLGTRATQGGYTSWSTVGENIYAYSNSVGYGHAGFAIDWGNGPGGMQSPAGHRLNIMNASFREIGISIIAENNASTQVGPLVITQDFGARSNQGNPFLLGVVFKDANKNNSYNAGEGLGGVAVTVAGAAGTFTTSSFSAGGYQLQVPAGTYTITFSGGSLASPVTKSVTVGSVNVKIDGIAGQTGSNPPQANRAPVLDAKYAATLSNVSKGATNPPGNSVASIVGTSISDPDSNALKGIAVFSTVSTNGKWQYSLNSGTTWTSFGSVTSSAARLLRSTDLIRFVPNSTFTGTATISYRAWDQTSGSAGGTASLASTGGSTAYSSATDVATVTVTSGTTGSTGNRAPVLNTAGTFTLPYVAPNSTSPPSMSVSTLLGTNVTDPDTGALKGMAITAIDYSKGTWQFSLNNGSNWTSLTAANVTSALLLRSTDLLRFKPKVGATGPSSFVFRAWDRTTGAAGTLANLTSGVGGSTAYSADQVFAQVQVGNTAPVLSTAQTFTLKSYTSGTLNPGTLISTLLGSAVSDVDLNAKRGIIVTGLTGTASGKWQYSTNSGATWLNFGATSTSAALLLRSQDLVRFVPNAGFKGQVTLQFRAWDQTAGLAGSVVKLTTSGGGTASYSSAIGTATLNIL